ncbi:MAG: GNAT family N-acetyltransferase [Geminicoccaceae bacterium]
MGKADVILADGRPQREAAFAVREAVFVDEQEIPLPLEFDGLDDEADHLLARLNGKTVGTLRLRRIGGASAKIERVAVLEHARGHGIGAALVIAAIEHLREQSLREARLHAQTYALGFYTKLGFTAFGDVFDEDGIPHRAMRMDLVAEMPPASAAER